VTGQPDGRKRYGEDDAGTIAEGRRIAVLWRGDVSRGSRVVRSRTNKEGGT
jgi:hypothetical protein